MFDLIIKNGICLTPSGRERVDIGIKNQVIVAIGNLVDQISADQESTKIIDAENLHVLPGLIDTQVHFREPGNEHKEDLESGTRSAVLGGITGVFEMPNTKPPTISKEALEDKLKRAKGRAWCDYAFFIGGTSDHASSTNWAELENLPGCCGIKIFMGSSTGNLLVAEDESLRIILSQAKRRVAIHSEDEFILKERFHIAQEGKHPRFHPQWRNEESALRSTQRLLKIAREVGAKVHVLHVTTKQEMDLLAQNKDIATVEILPQHLTLTDADYERIGTFAQMNPPIRSQLHQDALWKAVQSGIVDIMGSDHAPHTIEEKMKEYPESPAGMPGVQTLVPIMLNHINQGKLTLERFVDLMASSPARIYGISLKGRIAVGYLADFTIVDLKAERIIENKDTASKCGWTPYNGMKVKGWPTHTIIRGQVVMQNDKLISKNIGEPIQFI